MSTSPDISNELFNLAANLVNMTSRNIFLTGKAGTGKTTFLKWIRQNCNKKMAIVAPTGVAAINAGGVTIHSFFQLPFTPFIPVFSGLGANENMADTHSLISQLRLTGEKKKVMEELELLIIDEISMVRCDTLDAVDTVLKHVRKQQHDAFGGVQVLLIGDMFQLPPVIPDPEWNILSQYYTSPYFFDARCMQQEPPVYLEFTKIYRQSEERFVGLLNMIRNNELDRDGMALLDSRFQPGFRRSADDGYIILTTHNRKADAINELELNKIGGPPFSFEAEVEGEFSEKSFPADERLLLKVGAQVMFIRNDTDKQRRYFNGRIGTVTRLDGEKIFVRCNGDDLDIEVKKETWKNIRYVLDKKTRKLEEDELGSFTQYPLRLAWAITIHKSQGLTFEKAIVDAGEAFAPGQVYVALSRCTSLDGLVLQTRINTASLGADRRIVAFSERYTENGTLEGVLAEGLQQYESDNIAAVFDFKREYVRITELYEYCRKHEKSFNETNGNWLLNFKEKVEELLHVGSRFQDQLKRIYLQMPVDRDHLDSRLKASAVFFNEKLHQCLGIIQNTGTTTDSSLHAKEFNGQLREVYHLFSLKVHLLKCFASPFSLTDFLENKAGFVAPAFTVNVYAGSAESRSGSPHPVLHMRLRILREQICARSGLPIYLVAGSRSLDEMCRYLPGNLAELKQINGFGETKLERYGQSFLQIINQYREEKGLQSLIHEKSPRRERKQNDKKNSRTNTKEVSFQLYREGHSPAEIAAHRHLSISTIEGHLAFFIEEGAIAIGELVAEEKVAQLEPLLDQYKSQPLLNEIKEKCGPGISFGEIRMVLAWRKSKQR